MKNLNIFWWIMPISFLLPLEANAQLSNIIKNNIQFNYGVSRTLHYNQPVLLSTIICFEGCELIQQRAGVSSHFEMSYYRHISPKSDIKVGIGYTQHHFFELRKDQYIGSLNNYFETPIHFGYLTYMLGHRYWFSRSNKTNIYFESNLLYEKYHADRFYSKGGLSLKAQLGCSVRISNKAKLMISGFYKSAITNYTKTINTGYFPYGYGLEVGVSWGF